ncbi:unnamed protein product [Prunus armeniaca]
MANHLRPLFITANFGGIPIPKVMVDGGGITKTHGILEVDVIIGSKKLKVAFFVVDTTSTTYNALLGRDWIHQSLCVPSTLHQQLALWNEEGYMEIVEADPRPLLPFAMCFEARYYHDDLGPFTFLGVNQNGRPYGVTAQRLLEDGLTNSLEDWNRPFVLNFQNSDILSQSTGEGSSCNNPIHYKKIVDILEEFGDCFAWYYHEMPGLDRELVEHKLLIKEGYLPVKQARRRMYMDIELKVKEEVERLLKAGFIRQAIYADWPANIVPVLKRKTGAVRICVDYRNLNEASPKDEYPMPMADMLVDGAAHNQMLSFMDGNVGYNQIMVAEEDIHKTAFMCLGHIGAFEYTVMPFGLRNAGATYQRTMNSVFHDMIGHSLEVYIDDIVIKSPEEGNHMLNLRRAFLRMRQNKLKTNPKKCVFGVQAGNFLGFLVHQRGIEIDRNKAKSIIEALPPRNKKELQRKIQPFSSLLRLKQEHTFKWEEQNQQAFEEIKHYLSNPPVLSPPKKGRPLKLYVSASEVSIGSLFA